MIQVYKRMVGQFKGMHQHDARVFLSIVIIAAFPVRFGPVIASLVLAKRMNRM